VLECGGLRGSATDERECDEQASNEVAHERLPIGSGRGGA
jgi:hypothetical protein